uniref:UDP-glucuronosyltransferase n=1 Tax=Caenorhabditis japonica TaxID=281687 RepID=A0A8R1HTC2_CAEJA
MFILYSFFKQDDDMKRQNRPLDDDMVIYWTEDIDSSNTDTIFKVFQDAMVLSCTNFMRNKEVFQQMKQRNFDVAIVEPLSVCGLGYVKALGIEKTILASSCAFFDGALDAVGEWLDLSFVPSVMGKSGEQMTLLERLENYKVSNAMLRMEFQMWDDEMKIYREYLGEHTPHWRELLADASIYFTNSIPYVDFPRSVTQKTIPIGGISVDMDSIKSQKLPNEWSTELDKRPYNMLISFGSMVRSMDMPINWRTSLVEAMRSEPNVTFFWKYESDDVSFAKDVNNIHFSKWLPQTALLNDDRLTAFMTHGGLGSTMELAHLGKPALMIPVFADQHRNANMLARHGGALVVHKDELANAKKIRETIRSVLHEKVYKENAEKLAVLLENQPLKPKEQVLRYTEFVAKFGPFPKMNSHGRNLGFIERKLVDIHILIGLSYFLPFCFVVLSIWFVLSKISVRKVKNE